MKDELVLSLKHVTSGYREGGIFRKKTYQEVLHDVSLMSIAEKSWALWANPVPASPPSPARF